MQFAFVLCTSCGHYYVISVDLKKMEMDIIDNCPACTTNKSKYGNAPTDLDRTQISCNIDSYFTSVLLVLPFVGFRVHDGCFATW